MEMTANGESLPQMRGAAQWSRAAVIHISTLIHNSPGIDGIEVLRRIRATRPHLPVILLSGTVTQRQIETARELGVTDVLRKPAPLTHFAEALARVRQS